MTPPESRIFEFENFRLDAAKRLLVKDNGVALPLMPKALDILVCLVGNAGKVLEKEELMSAIWPDTIVEENNLTQNISALRRVLGEKHGENRFIATIPGKGYKFVAEVRELAETSETEASFGEDGDASQAEGGWLSQAGPSRPSARGRPIRLLSAALVLAGILGLGWFANLFWNDPARVSSDSPIRTIAVLPFKPLTIDQRNESMEMGMTDSLIRRLSAGEDLVVRPLFAVRRFASLDQDSLAAGKALAVEAVLDGSIQLTEDQIRVSARLLRVSDGRQLWANQFDEKLTDLFTVQDSISQKVAWALHVRLEEEQRSFDPVHFEAYERYMLGQLHATRLVLPEVERAIAYFEEAIEIDPDYALPYVGIAEAQRSRMMSNDIDPRSVIAQAKSAATRAVQLNPSLSEGESALGMIAFFYDWDWGEAEKRLQRAVKLSPNNAEARISYAHLLSNTGRHEEALAEARRARELNPVSLRIRCLEGLILHQAGETESAVANLEQTVELQPNFWLSHHLLSAAYLENGMHQEAVFAAEEAKRLSPLQTHSDAFKGVALARQGRAEEARALLSELLSSSRKRYVPPINIALLYAALGDSERALDYIEKAYREKDFRITFLLVDPRWNDLRAESRFIELIQKMNLN